MVLGTGFLDYRRDFSEVIVAFVDIDEHTAFAGEERFLKGRDGFVGKVAVGVTQTVGFELLKGHVGDVAAAVGGAVDVAVVHQHELSVFGFVDVDFDHVGAFVGGTRYGADRIFGSRTPVAAMSHDEYVVLVTGKQTLAQIIDM